MHKLDVLHKCLICSFCSLALRNRDELTESRKIIHQSFPIKTYFVCCILSCPGWCAEGDSEIKLTQQKADLILVLMLQLRAVWPVLTTWTPPLSQMVCWKLHSSSVWKSKLLVLIPQLLRALIERGKESLMDNLRQQMHVQPVRNTFMLNWITCLELTRIKMHKLWCQHLQYSTMTSVLMTEYTLHGNKELKVLTEWFREKLVQSGCQVEEIPGEWRSWRGECLMIFMASPTWTWTRCWSNPTEMRCKTFFILFRFFLFCQLRKSLQCPKEKKSDVRTSSRLSDLILVSTEDPELQ